MLIVRGSQRGRQPKLTNLNSISRSDSLELLVDYGINLQERELEITGDVNEDMYSRVARGLAVLNQLQVPQLTMILNTCGGDLFSALGIFDLIKFNDTPVDILVKGACMSAGAVILQAGRIRGSTPHTTIMTHYGSDHIESEFKNARRYMAHREDLEVLIERIFTLRCNWTAEKYDEINSKDSYYTAADALANGMLDQIVGDL